MSGSLAPSGSLIRALIEPYSAAPTPWQCRSKYTSRWWLTQSFDQGYGFSGILIVFLARNNPVAALVVALLLDVGRSLQVFYQIPFSKVQLIQAILVICVASSDFFIRHRIRRVQTGPCGSLSTFGRICV